MDKKGLEEILSKAKTEYPKALKKYQDIMRKYFPDKDCSERPNDSVRSFLSDYLYGKKKNKLKESERESILDFYQIRDCIENTEYALGLWKGSNVAYTILRLTDSKPMQVNGEDILITDPCYLYDCSDTVPNIPYLEHSTIYGDWSCTVRDTDTDKTLGTFCADTGRVGIFLLKDAKNCPTYSTIKEHPHLATIIPNFTGTVTIKVGFDDEFWDYYCYVEGKGNVNFESFQSGY